MSDQITTDTMWHDLASIRTLFRTNDIDVSRKLEIHLRSTQSTFIFEQVLVEYDDQDPEDYTLLQFTSLTPRYITITDTGLMGGIMNSNHPAYLERDDEVIEFMRANLFAWLQQREQRFLALMMAWHSRLGEKSQLALIEPELLGLS